MEYNLGDYVDIKRLISDHGYRIKKKVYVKAMEGLYVIKYDKRELCIGNEKTLGLFRSVITDGEKILCFAPPKSINFDVFSQSNDFKECRFEEFVEGTMINLFWNPIKLDWCIATRSSIGAKCKYNVNSSKTFRHMFLDTMNKQKVEFDMFDSKYCYSFVLQHPENRIVQPINEPRIVLTNVFCCNTDDKYIVNADSEEFSRVKKKLENLSNNYIWTPLMIKYPSDNYKNVEDWQSLIEFYSSDNLDYRIQGIIAYNGVQRTKFRSKNYERVKHLKGNSPKIQYQYLNLRQTNKVTEFLYYYPESRKEFSKLRKQLHGWTNQLYQNYINCYIKKQKPLKEFPYNFKIHMFNLHMLYIDELRGEKSFVSKKVVVDYVNNLPPPKLMYSLNYIYNKHTDDVFISESVGKYKKSDQYV